MKNQRSDRRLSNRYMHHVMQAIEEETGAYSLRMMLRNAGLERYIDELPPVNTQTEIYASEFAALLQSIRDYYGSGSRGSLTRIGRDTWKRLVNSASIIKKIEFFFLPLLPLLPRCQKVLNYLADCMQEPDGEVSVHLMDTDLIFVDHSSDSTFGQEEDKPICWITLGMIQSALADITSKEQDVEEITCRAQGEDACRFRARLTMR
jgi:predicted hydrocarbon binding protein